MSMINSILQIEMIVTILAALAVFGTVFSLVSPYLESDTLKSRMKSVTAERDRLRAAQKSMLAGSEVKLRDRVKPSAYSTIVDTFNLKKVFEAESSRILLRKAGYRSETHLMTFLAARGIAPIVLGVLVFVYSSTVFASRVSPNMRFVVAGAGLLLGYYLPMIVVKNVMAKRQKSIKRAWSDALDLLLICVEAGMALEPSMMRVAKEIGTQSVPLAEEMNITVAELSYLQDRRKAFENLSKRTGLETVRSVVTSLIQSERYGTPLGQALRVLAQENRNDRMADAERRAAALPPKLTVPMIVFFLPIIFAVILGPSIIMVTKAK